ncbi:ABC transporter permease [Bacteroidales bacterium OttesenSCG-928-A17]|nr:ABC transporter permease [Bacteroidales bacterium OttesenSCG-928-A17]
MSKEFFIARRIYFNQQGEKRISPPAVTISVVSIALSLTVMILALSIVVGFKREVTNRVVGFGSHIQITNFSSNSAYENRPIAISDTLLQFLNDNPEILQVQKYATKPGIIKTDEDFLGIVLKGIDSDYDFRFFEKNLLEGEVLSITPDSTSTHVLVSQKIADKLGLKLGDSFVTYFIQEPVRLRRFTITGIYQTNVAEYDKLFVFSDIKQIKRLEQWEDDMVSGLELLVKDFEKLDETAFELYFDMQGKQDRLGNSLYVQSIKHLNPAIFGWLDVLDMNVIIILILVMAVAGFSMISSLLIIILEQVQMIGILKTMGQNNTSIRKIFLYIAAFIIGKGLLWGNVISLAICFIQRYFGILKLDPGIYYVSEVPVDLNLLHILFINFGTLIVTILILIGPSYLIAKISPAKTIRFE